MSRSWLNVLWYDRHPLRWLLWPFSWLYQIIASLRRFFLRTFFQRDFSVPILVVGNISVGGVGKTPLVMALVKRCQEKGLRVGVVSRGYRARAKHFPHEVRADDDADLVGDEPLLIARNCGCPVVIAPKRVAAVQYLLEKYQSQIIISDDGLQHYAMGRAIEIIVMDGVRGLGNGLCLPAGPLRERPSRLEDADFVVVNGGVARPGDWAMTLTSRSIWRLVDGQLIAPEQLQQPVAAVAAIGHPERFFASLSALGIRFHPHVFPDHYRFGPDALNVMEKSVVMTEKDAVKCSSFAADNWYVLPVEAQLTEAFWQALWSHEQLKRYV